MKKLNIFHQYQRKKILIKINSQKFEKKVEQKSKSIGRDVSIKNKINIKTFRSDISSNATKIEKSQS